MPAHERLAWDTELAERLLAALDREDVFTECHCPDCDQRLIVEPRRRQRTLNMTSIEETGLRCRQCEFTASILYREFSTTDRDQTVMIDGRVIGEPHAVAGAG
jgi:DNA-directed RNA polymerase subunit RPC12/RpoP